MIKLYSTLLCITLVLIFTNPVYGVGIYEAEDAILKNLTVARARKGFSGTGYVTGFKSGNQSVTFVVEIEESGFYDLYVGYGAPSGYKVANLAINGEDKTDVELPEVEGGYGRQLAGSFYLAEGTNSITIDKGWGWYDVDYLEIQKSNTRPSPQISTQLSNPNSNDETRRLMDFLISVYGEYIISGQQVYPNDKNVNLKQIQEVTGKTPAILGLDFIEHSTSRVEHGARSKVTREAIDWHNKGGIVTFCWHWNAPSGLGKDGEPWWSGFYTKATTFDLKKALADTNSKDYEDLIRDMDIIAEELKILQKAGVPIIWRPLHEAEGGWFWWGASGPESVITLWKFMHDRFTNHHGLNNLIWLWDSKSPQWYPGDEWVDMLGFSHYYQERNFDAASGTFFKLADLTGHTKLVAMTENGAIPDPELALEQGIHWSYFVTWNGDFLEKWNGEEHLKKVYNHERVITFDNLADFRKE
ncbi:MAG: glycosyl hydrolase [Bacillota bacterium]|nr:glycosyl hydrolase [Bacillota bacterium]